MSYKNPYILPFSLTLSLAWHHTGGARAWVKIWEMMNIWMRNFPIYLYSNHSTSPMCSEIYPWKVVLASSLIRRAKSRYNLHVDFLWVVFPSFSWVTLSCTGQQSKLDSWYSHWQWLYSPVQFRTASYSAYQSYHLCRSRTRLRMTSVQIAQWIRRCLI